MMSNRDRARPPDCLFKTPWATSRRGGRLRVSCVFWSTAAQAEHEALPWHLCSCVFTGGFDTADLKDAKSLLDELKPVEAT
jgi:hypothetical protein